MAKKKANTPKKKIAPEEQKVLTERELRRYIKKEGGFRKGLSEKDKEICKDLLKKAGREEDDLKWNPDILVPGVDKPTVKGMVV
jgi:hypothetical protein